MQKGFLWAQSISKQKSRSHKAAFSVLWYAAASAGAKHVTVIAHVIVRHEQLTGKSLEVEGKSESRAG